MQREILFRGKRVDNGEWVEGHYAKGGNGEEETTVILPLGTTEIIEVTPESVGQFTGLLDKNGTKIFEGDLIRFRRPYRETQTHTGDNIPNGSYTEPMEAAIETIDSEVRFSGAAFVCFLGRDETNEGNLEWSDNRWDEEGIREAISSSRSNFPWDDEEEGDLQSLLETYPPNNLVELISWLSGIEIIGNIHDTLRIT